jgi:hypothetical protein
VRFAKLATVLAALPGLLAAGLTATSASATASTGRYIPETCAHSAKCVQKAWKPSNFTLQRPFYTLDDFGSGVTDIRWTYYTKTSARGIGNAYLTQGGGGPNQCSQKYSPRPCTDHLGRVVIVFYHPGGRGNIYFTRLHMTGQRSHDGYGLANRWRFYFNGGELRVPSWLADDAYPLSPS